MFKKWNRILAFLLSIALVTTTFGSDFASATAYAVEDGQELEERSGDDLFEEASLDDLYEDDEEEGEGSSGEYNEDEDESSNLGDDTDSETDAEENLVVDPENPENTEVVDSTEVIVEDLTEDETEVEENFVTVTYKASKGGKVSPKEETIDLDDEEAEFKGSTATAYTEYSFVNWTDEDGEIVSTDETFVPSNIEEDATFTANFEAAETVSEDYPAIVKPDVHAGGLVVSIDAEEGIFPKGTTVEINGISNRLAMETAKSELGDDVTAAVGVDITFYFDGKPIQPADDTYVHVNLELDEAIEGESFTVLHDHNGDVEQISADIETEMTTDENGEETLAATSAEFDVDNFSIFIVASKDSETARKVITYTFVYGDESTVFYTQSVKSGDTLNNPGNPPQEDNKVFLGWYIDGEEGEEDVLLDDLPMTIGELEEDDDDVTVTAHYRQTYYVTFFGTDNDIFGVKSVTVSGDEEPFISVDDMSYPPSSNMKAFKGWTTTLNDSTTLIKKNKEGKLLVNAKEFNAVYPLIVDAYWIHFEENDDYFITVDGEEERVPGGASYTGPQFLENGQVLSEARPVDPTRNGYTFGGWYFDAECTRRVAEKGDRSWESQIQDVVEKGKNDIYLYAKWNPVESTKYSIVIWKEKVTDRVGQEVKSYDYYDSDDTHTGKTGTRVPETAYSSYKNLTKTNPDDFDGFYFDRVVINTNKAVEEGTIGPKGDTVVNIYYNRKVMKIHFTGKTFGTTENYTSSNDTSKTMYGTYDGGTSYFQISRHGKWISGYYYTDPNGNRYNGTRYKRNTSSVKEMTYTGLFGQALSYADASYTWPDGDWKGLNSDGKSTYVTFFSDFIFNGWTPKETGNTQTLDLSYTEYDYGYSQRTARYYKQGFSDNEYVYDNSVYFAKGDTLTSRGDYYTGFSPDHYTQNGSTKSLAAETKITMDSDANLYYTRNKYTLTFWYNTIAGEPNTMKKVVDQQIYYQSQLSGYEGEAPKLKSTAGYTFDGWYADDTLTTKFDWNSEMPAADVAVYAKWSPVEYQVNVDFDGGSETTDTNFMVDYLERLDRNALMNTKKNGWFLAGWVYVSNDADNGKNYNFDAVTKDINIKALWKKYGNVNVVYDAGSHGSNAPTDTYKYAIGSGVVVAIPPTVEDGFVFTGWKVGNVVYTPSDAFIITESIIKNNKVILEAQYEETQKSSQTPEQYTTIKYHSNDGTNRIVTVSTNDDNKSLRVNEAVTVKSNTDNAIGFSREGYEFVGWNTNSSAETALVLGGQRYIIADNNGSNDLYAIWKPIQIKVYITGASDSKTYNGEEQTVTGYTVTKIEGKGYSPDYVDLKQGVKAEAKGTGVGEYPMNLTNDSFRNTNSNFTKVEFVVTDGKLTITKAKATVTADDQSKVYGEKDPELTWKVEGLKNNDQKSVLTVTVSRKAGENVGEYTITPAGEATQGNYDVEYKTGKLTINRKEVEVKANAAGKMYGTDDPVLTATVSGLKGNDRVVYSVSRATGEDVGEYTITPAGATTQGNYTVKYTTAVFTITQARVLITADAKSKVYGEEDPKLTVTAKILDKTITESIPVKYSIKRTAGENVGEYVIEVTGDASQHNYSVEYTNGTFTITKAKATVTADDQSKVYGESDPELTWKVEGLKKNDQKSVLTVTASRESGENVGEYTITPAGEATQGNYDVEYKTGKLTITKAKATVTAEDQSKVYGEKDPELTWKVEGLKKNDQKSVLTVTASRESGENVGEYTITPAGEATQGNYDVEYKTGKLTITKAKATVTAEDQSKVYGEKDPELTWKVEGLKNNDQKSVLTVTTSRESGENVGEYTIIPAGEATQGNYDVEYKTGKLTITKAKATVTAEDQSKVYGEKDPELTWKVEGLKNNDQKSVLTVTTSRKAGENVGEYTITPAGEATQGNYDVEYKTGKLTITKAKATVTAEDQSKVYGEKDPELTWKVEGLKKNDQKSVLTVTVSRESGENAGEYTITPAGEATQGNYDVEYKTGKFTINRKEVEVKANAAGKMYGTNDPVLTATVSGLKGNDRVVYSVSRATGEDVGEYTITPAGEATQGNYTVKYTTAVFTITQARVLITADAKSKVYGEEDPKLTVTAKILDKTITESIPVKYSIKRRAGENVGEYVIEVTGDKSQQNYSVEYTNGTFTITKAKATVTAEDQSKVYGEKDPELTWKVEGLKKNDKKSVLTVTASRESGENVGEYTITPAGEATQGNYDVEYKTGKLTITKAKATVTADDQSKVYGESDPELTWKVEGLKKNDQKSVLTVTASRESGENVGEYTITPAGEATQGNYDVEYKTGKLTIAKAKATVIAEDQSKVYGEKDPELTWKVEGLKKNDQKSVLTVTTSRESGENVGEYTITPTGEATQGNYDVEYKTGKLTITKAKATVIAEDQSKVYGEKDPELTWKVEGLKKNDQKSVLTVTTSRKAGENVGEYTITPAGAATQGNYDVEYKTGKLTITKAKATVTAEDQSKVYGESDPELTWKVEGLKNNDQKSVLTVTVSRKAGENAGEYTITPAGEATQGNYDVEYKTGKFTINRKEVEVKANAAGKMYGTNDPVLTATVSGLKGNDRVVYSVSRATGEDVGEYTITPAGEATQGNYTVKYTTAVFTITQARVLITADAKSKVYGEEDPKLTVTAKILDKTITESIPVKYSIKRRAGENVGEYVIEVTGDKSQQNYSVEYTNGTFTITKAKATVTAEDQSKVYGEKDPELTWKVEGLKKNDKKSVLTVTASRESGENVGEYTITPAGEATQGNYDVEYKTGKLTITKAKATVTADDQSKVYGESDPELTWKVEGLKKNDQKSVLTVTASRESGENVGEYTITPAGEATQGNYDVEYKTGKLTITKAKATVTAEDQSKVYGEKDPELTWKVEGLKKNDQKSVLTVTTSRESGENVGEYTITPTGEATQGNYDVEYKTGKLTITKAKATVIAEDQSKVYGEKDPELTWKVEGLKKNDQKSVLTVTTSRKAGENVGEYTITPAGAATQGNYDVEYKTGKLTITKASVSISTKGNSRKYNGRPLTAGAVIKTADKISTIPDDHHNIEYDIPLINGEVIRIKLPNHVTDVDSVGNAYEITKWVTADSRNYDIQPEIGTLEVFDRGDEAYKIKASVDNVTVTYSGETWKDFDYQLNYDGESVLDRIAEDHPALETFINGVENVVDAFIVQIVNAKMTKEDTYPITVDGVEYVVTGVRVATEEENAGSYSMVMDFESADITDPEGNHVRNQFSLEEDPDKMGVLVIEKAPVTVKTGGSTQTYNGSKLTNSEASITPAEDASEIVKEQISKVVVTATGSQTEVGSSRNTYDIDWADVNSENYAIEEDLGLLVVNPAPSDDDDDDDTPSGGDTTTIPDAPVALAPTGAVLGAQRATGDGPAVLGARRAGTDDETNRMARVFAMVAAAAIAVTMLITGKKKDEEEEG